MVDLSSTHWTPQERTAWREAVTPNLGIFSLVLCVIAGSIYYIFPRLRVFPRSILSWLNYYNIIFSLYIIIKWYPGSVHEAMVIHLRPDTPACRLGIFLDNFTLSGLTACDTLIALTVFLAVKMHMNLEANRTYFWAYLSFAVGFPLLTGLFGAFAFETVAQKGNPCVLNNSTGQNFLLYPNFFFLAIQLILIVWAMVYVREVLSSVRSTHSSNFPVKYLIIRFLATYLAQLYNLAGIQVYNFSITHASLGTNAVFARYAFASHASGAAIDAIVLTLSNVDFMNWIKIKIGRLLSPRSSKLQTINPMAVTLSAARIDIPSGPAGIVEAPFGDEAPEHSSESSTSPRLSQQTMLPAYEPQSDV